MVGIVEFGWFVPKDPTWNLFVNRFRGVSNNTARMKLWFPGKFGAVFPTLPWSQHHVVFSLFSMVTRLNWRRCVATVCLFGIWLWASIQFHAWYCAARHWCFYTTDATFHQHYRNDMQTVRCSLPEIGIAPDNQWLEDESLFWMTHFLRLS